ncbi:MAG: tetratricopeptide repeat protein, partial [Planctomycetota bacterium]
MIAVCGWPGAGFAQEAKADALAPLRRALANREWKSAEQLATGAINAKQGDDVDLLLLRAVARRHGGNQAGALADLRAVQGHAQAGHRSSKAAFRTAALLAEMGRSEEALKLTQTAVAALRADARRDAIARIYLDVVDELVRPKAEAGVTVSAPADPQWKSAYPLLKKAEELELKGAVAAQIQLDLLRAEVETAPRGANPVARAEQFLKDHAEHAALAEVRFLLGRARVKSVNALSAREAFLAVVQHHGDSEWAPKALDASAAALLKASLSDHAALAAGIADTEQLIASHAGHALAPPALFRLAESFAKRPAMLEQALAAMERCATRWPEHALAGTARLRQADLLAGAGRGPAAITLLQGFVQGRAVDAAWQAAVQKIADVRHTL